jgi:hypothetical protein
VAEATVLHERTFEAVPAAAPAFVVPHALTRMTGLPVEYLEALADHGDEVVLARRVARLLDDDLVVDGIATCNAHVVADLRRWAEKVRDADRLRSGDRYHLRTAVLYLQRLCTKCDSNGAFGPTYWAVLDEASRRPVAIEREPGPFRIGRRDVRVPYWVADSLLRTARSSIPESSRRVRRHPMVIVEDGDLVRAELPESPCLRRARLAAGDVRVRIVDLAATEPTLAELRAALRRPKAEVYEALSWLEEHGWITLGPEIPVGLADPLAAAVDAAAAGDGTNVRAVAARVRDHCRRYAETRALGRARVVADAGETVAEATGHDPTRGEGEFYADRYALAEHAVPDWRGLRIGAPVLRVVRDDLALVLHAFMGVACTRWRERHARLATWFAERFDDRPVSFPRFCAVAFEEFEAVEQAFAQAERVAQEVAVELRETLLRRAERDEQEVQAAREDVRDFVARHPCEPSAVQPDVMLLERNGRTRVVVGDLHAHNDLLVHGPHSSLHPDPDRLVGDVWTGYLSSIGPALAVPVLKHTDQTSTSLPLPTLDVEIAGRSRKGPAARVGAGELSVARRGERLELRRPDGTPLVLARIPLYQPYGRDSALCLFAPPLVDRTEDDVLPTGAEFACWPRVVVGDAVAVRRTWIEPCERFADDAAEIQRWWEKERAPVRVFARLASEQKPVLIDRRSSALRGWLAKRCGRTDGRLQLTEMYPDLDALWLRDTRGSFCVEFRLSFFLVPGALE